MLRIVRTLQITSKCLVVSKHSNQSITDMVVGLGATVEMLKEILQLGIQSLSSQLSSLVVNHR